MMKDADAFRLSSFSFGLFLQNKRLCVPPWMKDADASRFSSLGFALPLNERQNLVEKKEACFQMISLEVVLPRDFAFASAILLDLTFGATFGLPFTSTGWP